MAKQLTCLLHKTTRQLQLSATCSNRADTDNSMARQLVLLAQNSIGIIPPPTHTHITKLVTQAMTKFYSSKVAVVKTCKELFRLTGSLMGKVKVSPPPSVYHPHQLPQVFLDYFCSRVAEICDAIDKQACTPPPHVGSVKPFFDSVLTCFHTVTKKNVHETLQKMPPTPCELDPVPASLLLECMDEIAPVFTDIVHACLSVGSVPDSLKQALVKPLLKKPSLDPNILKNFRPVSNLPFVSKLLKKIVLSQLLVHLECNNLWHGFQSAYQSRHSTETAQLHVFNNLLTSSDSDHISVLTLLDLNAMFDTIDHALLLNRLRDVFGIRDTALVSVSYTHLTLPTRRTV